MSYNVGLFPATLVLHMFLYVKEMEVSSPEGSDVTM